MLFRSVYDRALVEGKRTPAITGSMTPDQALGRILQSSALGWLYVNDLTVAVRAPHAAASDATRPAEHHVESNTNVDDSGPTVLIVADPRRILPIEASEAAFGFSKDLFDTPRSVSVVSQQTIDLFGLSAVEDLVRFAPGVYTTTRFGIQGSVDVRNVPADTFFRGMKRLTLQGNGRSVLAAMDTIEVVGGPPSPIYGMGKIGGYTNMVPKSGRAANGEYLDRKSVV